MISSSWMWVVMSFLRSGTGQRTALTHCTRNVLTFSRDPREQTLNAFALAPGARIGGQNAVLGAAVSLPTFRRKPPLLHFLNPTIVFARCIVVSPNTGIRQIHVHRKI